MICSEGKFPVFAVLVLGLQVAFIIIFAFLVTYDSDAEILRYDSSQKNETERNSLHDYYPMFQHVNIMIFAGFGFLMTFLKKYSYSAVGVNMLLAAVSIQWGIILQGLWSMENGIIKIGVTNLIDGCFASATVLISFGALLGKANPLQLTVMTIIELAIYSCNDYLGVNIYKAADVGDSIFVHVYGAYFGLAVSYVLYQKEFIDNSKEGATYHSDIFAMIGTILLWMFWPSFNAVSATGNEQHRTVINTYLSLLSSCVTTFAVSSLVQEENRFNMVHIQNATLAGGVAIGATANVLIHPFGAMIVGAVAGLLSTLGYRILTPLLAQKLCLHDTCGVNNLHGMPGLFAGLISAIVAAVATEEDHGVSLYKMYPARSPLLNSTELNKLSSTFDWIEPGDAFTAARQANAQLEALFTTLAIALAGGVMTGYVIRFPLWDPPKSLQLFDDTDYWEVPDEDH